MARRRTKDTDYFLCPLCGAEVAAGASHCRACGASDDSGWGEENCETDAGGYGKDDDFDYDEYISREFPQHATRENRHQRERVFMSIVVVIVCLALLAWTIGFF